jgi:heavy metal sensor kinase
MRTRPISLRRRLTLWYSLALLPIIAILSLLVLLFVRARLFSQMNQRLRLELDIMTQVVIQDLDDVRELEREESPTFFLVVQGGQLYSESLSYRQSGLPMIVKPGPGRYQTVRTKAGREFRVMTAETPNGFVVTVAENEGPVRRTLDQLGLILLIAFPLSMVLAVLGGRFVAERMGRPLAALAVQASRIGAENLSERLTVWNPDDELGRLVSAFNTTLARLQDAFERLQRFTADASHELRTPLTAIQSVGEVALEEDLKAEEYRDRIGSMLEETARLTRLVDSLLLLTRADSGQIQVKRRKQDLVTIVDKAVEDMRVMAEEKNLAVRTEFPGSLIARVDPDMLRQALLNILDNAIKYTPPSGTISIGLRESSPGFFIEISDSGPGIPLEHREKIFDRFYRVEKDRSRDAGGAGLGLAIAKWAVEANDGYIEVAEGKGAGCIFRIVLPRDMAIKTQRAERKGANRNVPPGSEV